MEKNEMDRVKQRYTELANALGELSGLLDSLKKTIHKLEGLAALIDLQIDAVNPKRRTELSETQFNRYVADGYGLAELDCTLPDDYLEGMDDFTTCTAVPENADMMVKTKVTRNLNFIILDSRAYLYDENGKLMEVKQ